ncbi:MAG: M15 family metallopeptidase [Bacteriovoracia bacterium]
MVKQCIWVSIASFSIFSSCAHHFDDKEGTSMLPEGFVSLSKECPSLIIAASYATPENFTGTVVDGYHTVDAYFSKAGAEALCAVQDELQGRGLGLKIFDAYRPLKAVKYFQTWAKIPGDIPSIKERYYPTHTKLDLFKLGYIATESSHSRGSAVDLTIVNENGIELDMGTIFDFFHERSHTHTAGLTEEQKSNRELLLDVMKRHGFKNYSQEWWHFSLVKEAFPGKSFDFNID